MSDIPLLVPSPSVEKSAHHDVAQRRSTSGFPRFLSFVFGWGWRLVFGVWLCWNAPILCWFTSILVVGWLNRWMRARAMHSWWKKSNPESTTDFAALPPLRPRWLLPEKGWTPALWVNLKEGLATLFCITLVLGWGCMVMTFSWELGWINSIHKGYEQAWIGPASGLIGSLLFIAGLIYVPMARVHMAVTGEVRSFFEFRVIRRLITAKLVTYTLYMALVLFLAVVLEIYKTAPLFMYEFEPYHSASDAELRTLMHQYLMGTAWVLFLSLLLLHGLAARLYRSALLRALKTGAIAPEDLSPKLVEFLDRLDLIPPVDQRRRGLALVLRWTWEWYWRRFLYAGLLLIGLLFVAKTYTGEFLYYHPVQGFMNHPLLQFPCVDWYPQHLIETK